ncbi:MAG TPA: hypothetical protein PKC54_10890 [Ferruginibacter sp.]|nr:hypothetical protein [Ferruginibacter sp.]
MRRGNWKIEAKINAENSGCKKEVVPGSLLKKELLLIWKIKFLDMFNAPLLLFKEKEMEDEVKDQ